MARKLSRETTRAIEWDCTQLLTRFFNAFDAWHYDEMAAMFAPDGVWHRASQELQGATILLALNARSCTQRVRHVVTNILGRGTTTVQVERVDLQAGDAALLCSDGLTEMLPDGRIAAVLESEPDPRGACERLVAEANEAGGKDNITAVVARFEVA